MVNNFEGLLFILAFILTVIGFLVFRSLVRAEKNKKNTQQGAFETREVSQHSQVEDKANANSSAILEQPRNIKDALQSTQKNFWGRLKTAFDGGQSDQKSKNLDMIEEVLYTSDLGPSTVQRLMGSLDSVTSIEEMKTNLQSEFENIFATANVKEPGAEIFSHVQKSAQPCVWMVVGVNGAGKTTTIGKLSMQLAKQGKKVLVAAGDTFRAAAEAQLKTWTDRAQVEIFSPPQVTDPSAVTFDALSKAKAQGYDVVIIDTAGRLHNQAHLMEELKKVKRVMTKVIPEAPHETWIVLDANSGQNALLQAKEFHQALGLTGVILTKMDGTAKGGVVVGLAHELKIPIRFIGLGEKIDDLRAFSAKDFIASILDM